MTVADTTSSTNPVVIYVQRQLQNSEPVTFSYRTAIRGIKDKTITNFRPTTSGILDVDSDFTYTFNRLESIGAPDDKRRVNMYVVYVLEIDGDPNYVYVGQTSHTRDVRLHQHLDHYKSAPSLRHAKTLTLRDDLYDEFAPTNQNGSLAQESLLAINLRARGFNVEGGH